MQEMKFTIYTADCTGNERNTLYPNQRVITCEGDLKKSITADHVCAQYQNNTRSDANFMVSDVVPMDCDNDHSDNPDEWITPEFLADNLCDVAFAVTYSRHHMLAKGSKSARPRFHVFFPTAPCNDPHSHKAIKAKIYMELPFFDGNALDASRFLFGCPSDVFWHEGSLSIEDWLTLMKSNRNIPEGQRNSTMSRIAGKLVKRFGVMDTAYQKFLEKASECSPPLPDAELETIWHSACKFGKKVTSQEGYISPEEYGSTQTLIHNRKLDALEDIIESANGKPVLVAYWFKHDRTRIAERLGKLGIVYQEIKSAESIKNWNSGKLQVALIHPASAGHGLNLQSGGNFLVWFGLTWSLELYQQTNARLWRQGQQSETVIIQHMPSSA